MKRTFIAIIMLAGWMQTACAQHTIESIRKAYQENWEVINMMSDNFPSDGIPPEYYHVHVAQNLPGTGGHQENVRYYYGELESDEDVIYPPHYLKFVTSKYNFAAREFYEEYLYDNKGHLIFVYARTPDVDFPKMHEIRLYYDGKKLLRLQVKEATDLEYFDDKAIKKATFKEVYTGTKIPSQYAPFIKQYTSRAERFLEVFKSIDNNTYL